MTKKVPVFKKIKQVGPCIMCSTEICYYCDCPILHVPGSWFSYKQNVRGNVIRPISLSPCFITYLSFKSYYSQLVFKLSASVHKDAIY